MSKNNRFRKFNTTVLPAGRVRISNWPLKEKFLKIFIYAVMAVVAYFFLAGNAGLIHLVQSKLEKAKIEKDIVLLEEENKSLKQENVKLKSQIEG